MEITLNPKRIAWAMLIIIGLLAVMHITQLVIFFQVGDPDVFDFVELLDFDYEANFPSFYSAAAIIFCALLLWIVSVQKLRERAPFRYHWLGLMIIFLFLGLDEATALHEEFGDLMEEYELVDATGFLYFAWVVPYGILMVLFVLSYLKFVLSLPRSTMILFLAAGGLFLTGAIGIEVVSAREADINGTETVYYSVLYTIEELCEMVAMVIFSYGLLRYIEATGQTIQFHIRS